MYVLCVVCYIHVYRYVYRLYIIDDFRPVVHGTHSNSFRFFSFSGFRAGPFLTSRQKTNEGGDHTTNDVAIGHAIFSQNTQSTFFFWVGGGEGEFVSWYLWIIERGNFEKKFKWEQEGENIENGKSALISDFYGRRKSEWRWQKKMLANYCTVCISSCDITQHTNKRTSTKKTRENIKRGEKR